MPGVAVTGIDSAGGIIQPTQVGVTFIGECITHYEQQGH